MTTKNACALVLSTLVGLSACTGTGGNDAPSDGPNRAPAQASPAAHPPAAAARVERAGRNLDLGHDAAAVRAEVEAILAEPDLGDAEREEATLTLGRALEALGDLDGAASAYERILAAHTEEHGTAIDEAAETALRRLLTGDAGGARGQEPRNLGIDDEPVAPFAKALAKAMSALDVEKFVFSAAMFGNREGVSRKLGTFNVGGAMHQLRREECPLCESKLSVYRDESRYGSWLDIPRRRDRIGSALAVFYFDLGQWRLPSRYDDLLPMKSADIVARLEKGEGVVAAKTRAGAPPVVLVAAPRAGQLPDVEAALAALEALPLEPVAVPLKGTLKPEEIQLEMRAARATHRACYEALLGREPGASGKALLKFAIEQGRVLDATVDRAESTLLDGTFTQCLADAVSKIEFPVTATRTTVAYPLVFTPGNDR